MARVRIYVEHGCAATVWAECQDCGLCFAHVDGEKDELERIYTEVEREVDAHRCEEKDNG